MKTYETVVIFDPVYDKEVTLKESIDIVKDMCQEFTGKKRKIKMDELGEKKLAYPMRERDSGYYCVFTWQGTAEDVETLERCMRITDKILKFITVTKDEDEVEEWEEFMVDETVAASTSKSEQPDALDVLLGFASYNKKEVI